MVQTVDQESFQLSNLTVRRPRRALTASYISFSQRQRRRLAKEGLGNLTGASGRELGLCAPRARVLLKTLRPPKARLMSSESTCTSASNHKDASCIILVTISNCSNISQVSVITIK